MKRRAATPHGPRVGARFGPFELTKRLGRGGMADIWLGRRDTRATPVVVKTVLAEHERDRLYTDMFMREAAIGLSLAHPNIVETYDLSRVGSRWFIELEYYTGPTLRTLLSSARRADQFMSIPLVLSALIDACLALAHMHAHTEGGQVKPLVHRDISPENLIIGESGVTKIIDFGLSSTLTSRLTNQDQSKGKLHYMPPEAFFPSDPLPSRDIYAVGSVLYELLTLKQPYVASTNGELMGLVINGPMATSPRTIRKDLPEALDELIMTTLSRKPGDRRFDAQSLATALATILKDLDPRPRHQIAAAGVRTLAEDDTMSGEDDEPVFSIDVDDVPDLRVRSQQLTPVYGADVLSAAEEVVVEFPSSASRAAPRARRVEAPPCPPPSVDDAEPTATAIERAADAPLLKQKGLDFAMRGELEAALAAWQQALKLAPDDENLMLNIDRLKQRMEDAP